MLVGEKYTIKPSSVRFDQEMVEFNRVHTDEEYQATKLSISGPLGQTNPIIINSETGLCEDGRHRVKACTELAIDVVCVQIDGSVYKETRLEYYNLDAMSGRDLSPAQRAVQAHKFAKLTGVKLDLVAKKFKTNTRQVNDANAIAGLGREDVLTSIVNTGEWTMPSGKISKSLRTIAAQLKSEAEHVVEEAIEPTVNYEDLIRTEKGKAEFWRMRTLAQMSQREMAMMLVELVNLKYKLVVNETTGEVKEE